MNYIIVVEQRDVLKPRLYKTDGDVRPTNEELIELGADIVPQRMDVVTIDAVSDALWNAVHARYLFPTSLNKPLNPDA